MDIKMESMHEQSEGFNTELESIKKYQTGHRAQEYNNWSKKFNTEVQHQTRSIMGKKSANSIR